MNAKVSLAKRIGLAKGTPNKKSKGRIDARNLRAMKKKREKKRGGWSEVYG
ncbi:MAG: hypothetical protein WB661_07720 [Candidatus Bathyarchaeia archaeon]